MSKILQTPLRNALQGDEFRVKTRLLDGMRRCGKLLRRMPWLALCLMLCAGCAAAQTLPSVACFSPGLARMGEAIAAGGAVKAEMSAQVGGLFLARDVSVLDELLRGLTMEYEGSGGLADGADSLLLTRDGVQLLALSSVRRDGQNVLRINETAYALPEADEQQAALANVLDTLVGAPFLERVPLADIEALLLGLSTGDGLMNVTVETPFAITETYSDDGARLTKLDISGAVAVNGQVWRIGGFLRQPGGNAPKDTFELTAALDENNTLSFSYASTRKSEITSKNRAGTNSVSTALTAGGKLDGCSVSMRLNVTLYNNWRAEQEQLTEKITGTATFGLTDKRPGRQMLRLNDVSAKLKQTVSLTTAEAQTEPLGAQDALTLTVTMDGFDVADGSAQILWQIGQEAAQRPELPQPIAQADADGVAQAIREATARAAAILYKQLGESSVKRVTQGLEEQMQQEDKQ